MLKNKKNAFTLVELLISITITTLLITWFTMLYFNISDSIEFSKRKVEIYNDVKDFITKISYSSNLYNSWFIITSPWKYDTLILTDSWLTSWYIIWVYDCNNKTWLDSKLASWTWIYSNNCLWYFPLKQTQINTIISNSWTIYTSLYNAWIVYPNLFVSDFFLKEFSPNHIFDFNINFYDKYYPNLEWSNISNIDYDMTKLIHVNLNL